MEALPSNGRDRDKIIDLVMGADTAYARKLGVKHRQPDGAEADEGDAHAG